MAEFETLELSIREHVGQLNLSRPALMNRFDDQLVVELARGLRELDAATEVRAIVLTADGQVFSAGGDTDSMLAANADHRILMKQVDDGRRLFRTFSDITKPLIVALHGHIFGVGTSLILTADAIVSTPSVRLSDPHVQFGLVPGDGGVVTWPMNLPMVKAKRHLLWAEPLMAEDAYRLGVVTDLVDTPAEVTPRAFELADRVSALPPVAVQLAKRAFNKSTHSRVEDVFDAGFYLEAISASTSDVREAVNAFKEKRTGKWLGQ
ncbi:enoyl-CoA hydratase/isomerase family protein [Rhodococcus opacus]|uniref:Enoyl-CoA hydratase n=1 Tax=Rhodococcus opacus TaxID=37919 RepID=A0A076F5H7_RHOOP|nr:enoyl-CoA hydratase/isomerase family protein [Rhodococcus opacus]AII10919.1 enoyl-CoA hydratase [Rhodococcus opacus]